MTVRATAADNSRIIAGTAIPPFVVEDVNADHIKLVALLLRDPNPIHFDRDAVRVAGLGDREVNQGGTTLAYIYDMLIAWTGSRAAVRRVGCQFRANVFAGDRVSAGGVVTAVRQVEEGQEADCEVWADRADGVRAIRGTATVLLRGADRV
jgi:acyl dehydratase